MATEKKNQLGQKKDKIYAVKANEQINVKDVDLTKRIVTGYYNSCYFFDSDQDVSLPGSYNKSISEHGPSAPDTTYHILHLKGHDWNQEVGRPHILQESTDTISGVKFTGLYFETKMPNTTLGNDMLINYQEKVHNQHSMGFRYEVGMYIEKGTEEWDRLIQKLLNPEEAEKYGFMYAWKQYRVREGSTVAFGANELTPYLGVKSLENSDALLMKLHERMDLLNNQVRNGKQSDMTLHSFEMQLLQLKQITTELFTAKPSEKDTATVDRHTKDTQKKAIDFGSLITN